MAHELEGLLGELMEGAVAQSEDAPVVAVGLESLLFEVVSGDREGALGTERP